MLDQCTFSEYECVYLFISVNLVPLYFISLKIEIFF